jgi:hypothetical protein
MTGTPLRTYSRDHLVDVLEELQAGGVLTAQQSAAVLDRLDHRPAGRPPAARSTRLAEAAAYAGAGLAAAAGALLVGQQWDELGRPGRVAVLLGVSVVLAAVGVVVAALPPRGRSTLRLPAHAVRRRLASTAVTVATGTAAGAAAVLVPGHALLAASLLAVGAISVVQWAVPSAVSEIAAAGAALLLAGAVLDEAQAAPAVVVATLAAGGIGWALLSWTRVLTLPTPALALGLGLALVTGAQGAFGGRPGGTTAVGLTVLGLLAAGGLGGYVLTGRWPLAAAGVLALAALALRITSDSLSPALALLLSGVVLLGAGGWLFVRRRPRG